MKVLQTIGGFQAKNGGTSTCTYDLLTAIHHVDPYALIDLLTPDSTTDDDPLIGNDEWIKSVPFDYKTPLALSRNISSFLKSSEYDIYHTNGMWMHVNHATCVTARKKDKPYIITPHGMLYPEAMARSAWKKLPVRKLWFDKDIRKASCIHATCMQEMRHVRDLDYYGPIAVIGNPVVVPEFTERICAKRKEQQSSFLGCNLPRKLGFLGRLHPIKNVENILYGVSIAGTDVEIIIMGKGVDVYESFLHNECQRLGIEDKVHFLGFVNGKEKYEQLAKLDCLMVPSDMENFGMIIPEAMIVGTPVMASLGTPWESLNKEKCGWWVDNSPESIANVIQEVYDKSKKELLDMGMRGREYIIKTFAPENIASQMLDLYKWLNGECVKPEFVYT